MKLKWDRKLEIGIEAIDTQHMKIFEHLLALENSVTKRDQWNIVRFFLAQLEEYMKFHLAVEEALLEIICYPDLAEHNSEHEGIMNQIKELERQLKQTHNNASGEKLVNFFENWFINHVLKHDRQYAAYAKGEFPALFARPRDQ